MEVKTQYRMLGRSEIKVSTVGHGTWAAGGKSWGDSDDRNSVTAIRASLDNGVNLIDTAPVYGAGHAEELVGRALEGVPRDNVIISTKCGLLIDQGNRHGLRPDDIRRECDASLQRLRTDYIDVYFFHWPDHDTPIEESVSTMTELREAGKIRAMGLSNHGPDLIRRACAAGDIVCLQEQYSLLKRDIEDEIVPLAEELSLGIMAYAPLASGVLTGKYTERPTFGRSDARRFFYPFYEEPYWSRTQELLQTMRDNAHNRSLAEVALAWTVNRPAITCALAGAKSTHQATANAAAATLALSPSEMAALTKASDTCLEGVR